MFAQIVKKNKFVEPHGGLVIWIFILSELFVFGVALNSFAYEKSLSINLFEASKDQLNQLIGTVNTIVLITSGFFIAHASRSYHLKNEKQSIKWLLASFIAGLSFLILKGIEYSDKIDAGLTLGHNTFFDYYWMLTVFHALHVVVGLVIILMLIYNLKTGTEFTEKDFGFETGCIFWHMCDFIWVLVFPIIYLL